MFARWRKTKQFCEARFVRLAGRTIAIWFDPFWMLHAQSVVDLLLKLRVRTDLLGGLRRCLQFHLRRYRRLSRHWYFAYAGFSSTTREVIRNPSFEIERGGLIHEEGTRPKQKRGSNCGWRSCPYKRLKPRWMALATASVRLMTFILAKMAFTCDFAVSWLIKRAEPISLLPSAPIPRRRVS